MSYVEGAAGQRIFSKRSRVAIVALTVMAMLGTGLTLGFTSSGVDAAPVADVVDGTICYSIDEGGGNSGQVQAIHEITLSADGVTTTAAKTSVSGTIAGVVNIENIAIRNDTGEIYVYDADTTSTDQMYLINPSTGVLTTPTDFALSGEGDIDAMFFQHDADGDTTNDILWIVEDIDDGTDGNVDQDILRSYSADGTLLNTISLNLPADATVEGATWVDDGAGGGEFLISYTNTGASTDSTLASLGTGATPSATPSTIGTTQIDVEGLGTDADGQVFLTTGEDGADRDNLYHVDEADAGTTFLLDLADGAPGDHNADFESVDCAFAGISIVKTVDDPVRLANGNTELTYTFTLTNDGTLPLEDVEVTDPMTAFTGNIVSGPTADDVNGDCSSGVLAGTETLNIDETCTAVWTYVVDVAPADYDNTATVAGTPAGNIGSEMTDSSTVTATVPAAQAPGLAIIKSVAATQAECPATYADAAAANLDGLDTIGAAVGDTVYYCINVINNGPGDALDVEVDDTFASGTNSIGDLAVGEETQYSYEHTVTAAPETNTATASGTDADGGAATTASDTAGTVLPDPDDPTLQIIKSVATEAGDCPASYADALAAGLNGLDTLQIAEGATAFYCIAVHNAGPGDAINVSVADPMDTTNPRNLGNIASGSGTVYSYSRTVGTNPETNTATLTGEDTSGNAAASATDQAGTTEPDPQTGTISDFVFSDTNQNGLQDNGEPGVPGLVVNLLSADGSTTIQSTTTAADGSYSFTNVPAGDYIVEFVAPTGRTFTSQNQGTDDSIDSDADPTTGRTGVITLAAGEVNDSVDAGLDPILGGTISDTVFQDSNQNGVQDNGEAGVPGVVVNLLGSDGTTVVGSTTTDANGNYSFDDLAAGTYFVQFVAPTGRTFTAQDAGTDDSVDSDADPATGTTGAITLGNGETIDTVDAGLLPVSLGSISDTVWEDSDGDGVQDDGEPGIPGVVVNLLSNNGGSPGTIIGTATTDASGNYSFDNLAAGEYFVQFVIPTGRTVTSADQGGDDSLDSDADPTTGMTSLIMLGAGEHDTTIDAGLLPISGAAISDTVWEDSNTNGVQDDGEPGIPGVRVNLLAADGTTVIATDVTDANGNYAFEGLPAGTNYIQFVLPNGRTFTSANVGDDDTVDSDADTTTGRTEAIVLAAGDNNTTVDAGLVPIPGASISDLVFVDANSNGILDDGEVGQQGVTVNLLSADGNTVATDTTDATGTYLFANLGAGDYIVEFVAPTGRTLTTQNAGTDDTIDSDADPATGRTGVITLGADEDNHTVDAGLLPVVDGATISDLVFEDTNRDGVQSDGEPGVSGVTVNLWNDSDGTPGTTIATTTTDADGRYAFTDLAPGTYYVQFRAPTGRSFTDANQGDDDTVDSDPATDTGMTEAITVGADEVNSSVDAGLLPLSSLIGNRVWNDLDGDGVQDDGEPGVAGVILGIYEVDADGRVIEQVGQVTTDDDGLWTANVAPGLYRVAAVKPDDALGFTVQDNGDDATDSDASVETATLGWTGIYDIAAGTENLTIDAGLLYPATIGDRVFQDTNGDGIQSDGEPGVADITVQLKDSDDNVVDTTKTDSDGLYSFDNVAPGDYTVTFVSQLDGSTWTTANQGDDDALDSDVDPATGSVSITAQYGQTDTSIDAGLILTGGVISDTVFEDTDGDNIRDAGEPGVGGVTVRLLDADGDEIRTTTTSNDGRYAFSGLEAGSYIVEFVAPDGRSFVTMDEGDDDTVDSDADPTTGRTAVIVLAANEFNTSVDAGLVAPEGASISNIVFDDADGDGIQDQGEAGLSGVVVNLLGDDGSTVVATTTTDSSGLYMFDGLDAGTYYLQFVAPDGRSFSPQDEGDDDTVDSDADPATGRTAAITLTENERLDSVDAGILPAANPAIGLAKRLTSGPSVTTNGYRMTFTFVVENLGNTSLSEILITDDFAAAFPSPATIVSGPTAAGGDCSAEVLSGTGHTLDAGESCTAVWSVVVSNLTNNTTYSNVATVSAKSPSGATVSDTADDGTDPDPNGNGDAGDDDESDPTRIQFSQTTGCTNNEGQVIPDQSACPGSISYSPFTAGPENTSVPATTPVNATPATDSTLAHTGTSSTGVLATLAVALLGAGGALMIGARRRDDEF